MIAHLETFKAITEKRNCDQKKTDSLPVFLGVVIVGILLGSKI